LNAVKALNDTKLDNRKIHCREDRKDDDPAEETDDSNMHYDEDENQRDDKQRQSSSRFSATSLVERGDKVADPKRVFVSNLSYQTTMEELTAHLESAGDIASATIKNKSKRGIGSAVIEFCDPSSAAIAIATLNNQEFGGRNLVVREYYQ